MQQSPQRDEIGRGGHPQYLEPSELGTKEYWETYYTRSLEHIASKKRAEAELAAGNDEPTGDDNQEDDGKGEEADDDDDPGTSWFSEHDAPLKVLKFLTSRKFPLSPRQLQRQQQQQHPSILDLGTGNGSMLALLRKRGGFKGEMVGVDYSAQSVQLARELQRLKLHSAYESDDDDDDDDEEELSNEEQDDEHEDVVVADNTGSAEAIPVAEQNIRFEEWDILDPTNEDALELPPDSSSTGSNDRRRIPWFPYQRAGFDIVLDKGTFDAVSLSDETIATDSQPDDDHDGNKVTRSGKTVQPRICHKYPRVAAKLVRPGGFLVVTSCNWTEEELVQWFTATAELQVWGRVEYPRFRFGGHEGQGVCTVCFRRKER